MITPETCETHKYEGFGVGCASLLILCQTFIIKRSRMCVEGEDGSGLKDQCTTQAAVKVMILI